MDLSVAMAEERKKLEAEKAQLDERLAAVNAELKALDAYERAKSGTTVPVAIAPKGQRRTGIREEVLAQITEAGADGITRAELLIKMDAKGNKPAEQSISNAVAALKKAGIVSGEDGTYRTA